MIRRVRGNHLFSKSSRSAMIPGVVLGGVGATGTFSRSPSPAAARNSLH